MAAAAAATAAESPAARAVVVGAGPSGLAVAACLSRRSVPCVVLERDDCIGSLWRKRSYDRVHLHLAKKYCDLPYAPHSAASPEYLPKHLFIRYLEDYAGEHLASVIRFGRRVVSARFESGEMRWRVTAVRAADGEEEMYSPEFLVVAAGENDEKKIPAVEGMEGFTGKVLHSSEYRSGEEFRGMKVLVVGAGNSGMEIADDLAGCGAAASVVVRSQLHLVTKEIWNVGMGLLKWLPISMVDAIVLFLCYLKFGNTSKYGLKRPTMGPFHTKINTPLYPVVDVGTFDKIRKKQIMVLPAIHGVAGSMVTFENGKQFQFDAIIFATGYRSTINTWLQGGECVIGEDGMAKQELYPNHWKGVEKKGLYCIGLARRGLYGAKEEALLIAQDIAKCCASN